MRQLPTWLLLLGTIAITGLAGCNNRVPSDVVTVRRDAWGIPHIVGPDAPSVVYGFAYAQAEDNLAQIESSYIRALGRYAEVAGEVGVGPDRLNRLLQIPELAQAEYQRLDPEMRAIVDAFAAGLNAYVEQSGRPLTTLERFEGWHPLALLRFMYFQNGFAQAGIREGTVVGPGPWEAPRPESQGSNGWVIGSTRTANGSTLLLINPHLPNAGPGQVYEGHLLSGDGWNFTGYTRFGLPFPYVGHNPELGWVSTDNAADHADLYLERFDDPANPLSYRYGNERRLATEWIDTIKVRTDSGVELRPITLRATHHGPIVGLHDNVPVALRIARLTDDGWLREWYDMTRATDLDAFKAAMRPTRMLFGNAMYADRTGKSFYVYNGAIPRRDTTFDWTRPVEGSDPATEWQGYHDFDSLPSLSSPPSGWMQNCNGTPFLLSDIGNPDRRRFPNYLVREADNARSARSRALLSAPGQWTFESLQRAAFDTRLHAADSVLTKWLPQIDTSGSAPRREAVALLAGWDRHAEADSRGMALYDAWHRAVRDSLSVPVAFDSAVARLTARFGRVDVEWGNVLRVVRAGGDSMGTPGSGAESFHGAVFTTWGRGTPSGRIEVTGGTSYLSVVEFSSSGVRGVALHVFGANNDPASPHFTDQARLMASRTFRPTWLSREDVEANTTVSVELPWGGGR